MRTPEPRSVRDHLHEVLSRPEFQRHKNPLQRFFGWLARQLQRLSGPGGGSWGGVGSILQWLLIAALVVGVLTLAWWVVRHWVSGPRAEHSDAFDVDDEVRRTAGEWRTSAERFEAAEDWKHAIRCRYNELVALLVERQPIADVPGRTTGEYRLEVGRVAPGVLEQFSEATLLFELPWYGDRPTGRDENRRFRDLAAEVLAAPVATTPGAAVADGEAVVRAVADHAPVGVRS